MTDLDPAIEAAATRLGMNSACSALEAAAVLLERISAVKPDASHRDLIDAIRMLRVSMMPMEGIGRNDGP